MMRSCIQFFTLCSLLTLVMLHPVCVQRMEGSESQRPKSTPGSESSWSGTKVQGGELLNLQKRADDQFALRGSKQSLGRHATEKKPIGLTAEEIALSEPTIQARINNQPGRELPKGIADTRRGAPDRKSVV